MANKVPDTLRKFVSAAAIEENAEAKTFTFVASDDSVDRYGDTIDAKGWELENFSKNPVILLNHKSGALPIGRAVRTWVDGNKLKTEIKFVGEDENPDGPRVEKMIQRGNLRALSVGFRPKEATDALDRQSDGWYPPQNFKKQELLEISVVTVPANPNAMIESKAAAEDAEWMRAQALLTLEQIDGPGRYVTAKAARATRSFGDERKPVATTPIEPLATPKAAPVVEEISKEQAAEMVRAAVLAHRTKQTGKL